MEFFIEIKQHRKFKGKLIYKATIGNAKEKTSIKVQSSQKIFM